MEETTGVWDRHLHLIIANWWSGEGGGRNESIPATKTTTVHFWKCKQGSDSWYSDTNPRAKISSTRYFDQGANKVKCSLIWWELLTGDLTKKMYLRLLWHIITFNRNEEFWFNIIFKGYCINSTHSNAACNLLQWCHSVDNSYVDSWYDTMLRSCFELWLDKVMSEGGRYQQRVIKYTHRVFWRPTSLAKKPKPDETHAECNFRLNNQSSC